jgi:hypothetical protein
MGALVYVLPPTNRSAWPRRSPSWTSSPTAASTSGWGPYELAYFGIDAGQARARYTETLDLVTRALAPVNYFEATLAFGDLTPAEAQANLAAFAETAMPAVRQAGQSQA